MKRKCIYQINSNNNKKRKITNSYICTIHNNDKTICLIYQCNGINKLVYNDKNNYLN